MIFPKSASNPDLNIDENHDYDCHNRAALWNILIFSAKIWCLHFFETLCFIVHAI